jgi:hypothetical protein
VSPAPCSGGVLKKTPGPNAFATGAQEFFCFKACGGDAGTCAVAQDCYTVNPPKAADGGQPVAVSVCLAANYAALAGTACTGTCKGSDGSQAPLYCVNGTCKPSQ